MAVSNKIKFHILFEQTIKRNCKSSQKKSLKNYHLRKLNTQILPLNELQPITKTPFKSLKTVEFNTVSLLRLSEIKCYVLTVQDVLLQNIIVFPMPNKEAKTVAETLVNQFILKCGLFKNLKSDYSTELKNN